MRWECSERFLRFLRRFGRHFLRRIPQAHVGVEVRARGRIGHRGYYLLEHLSKARKLPPFCQQYPESVRGMNRRLNVSPPSHLLAREKSCFP